MSNISYKKDSENLNIIIPQYHSNYCVNDCKYCGFKKSNKLIPRKRLSFDEFKYEFNKIIEWGYRTIEFVFSSDPFFNAIEIAKRINYAKESGQKRKIKIRIGINTEPFEYKDYKLLYSAGLDFFVLWMETYSKDKYSFWHGVKTPKSDYNFRLSAYNEAIEAGIKNYGLGVLFGLNDWKYDVDALIQHGKKLEKQYGFPPYIIGLPRFKKAHSVSLNGLLNTVSDDEFKLICKTYKQSFPTSMLFFNTRENLKLNIDCCNENDLFTIDCGTFPGAFIDYNVIKKGYEQFHTYYYDRKKILKKLEENDKNPIFEW